MADSEKLQTIADEIKRICGLQTRVIREGLFQARRLGQLLRQAKEEVGHGNWTDWIAENCSFSQWAASMYMQIDREWDKIIAAQEGAEEPLSFTRATEVIGRRRPIAERRPAKQSTAQSNPSTYSLEEACKKAADKDLVEILANLLADRPNAARLLEMTAELIRRLVKTRGLSVG